MLDSLLYCWIFYCIMKLFYWCWLDWKPGEKVMSVQIKYICSIRPGKDRFGEYLGVHSTLLNVQTSWTETFADFADFCLIRESLSVIIGDWKSSIYCWSIKVYARKICWKWCSPKVYAREIKEFHGSSHPWKFLSKKVCTFKVFLCCVLAPLPR